MTQHWFRNYRDWKRKLAYRLMSKAKREKKDKLEYYEMKRAKMKAELSRVQYEIQILDRKILDLEKEIR